MRLILTLVAIIFLCSHDWAIARANCEGSVPMVNEEDVFPGEKTLSLRKRLSDSEIDQASLKLSMEDARQSGLNLKYMYGVRMEGEAGYFLIFVDLRKDEAYVAYRVFSSNVSPIYKFSFYYMFMPEQLN